jgi:hypothetical protein
MAADIRRPRIIIRSLEGLFADLPSILVDTSLRVESDDEDVALYSVEIDFDERFCFFPGSWWFSTPSTTGVRRAVLELSELALAAEDSGA